MGFVPGPNQLLGPAHPLEDGLMIRIIEIIGIDVINGIESSR
jgi:hypothetical protein